MLLDFEEVFYLNQIIKIPTRENNILFLVFVCMGEELNVISSYYPVQSDPNIFAVTFDKIGKHGRKENKVGEAGNSLKSLDFDQIDWEMAYKSLHEAQKCNETLQTPDDMLKKLYDACRNVCK